ncbi:MAG: hypothetical protein N2652_03235 [Kiritimatiellae bacterium]|nr:hypothetical protein [Kiritimatiellia bacterium]
MKRDWSRREWLACVAGVGAGTGVLRAATPKDEEECHAPVRPITRGPGFHWFGYYDKEQFSTDGRLVLGNRVTFEHRSPTAEDRIELGMVDLQDGDRWVRLGSTRAWNWQQGCMLQWRPGHPDEVIWNDREGDDFVARIRNVRTGAERVIGSPVYAISPDGRWAVAPDFRRLHDVRPGYGYAGVPDPRADVSAPDDTGIWRVELETGRSTLILSFAAMVAWDPPPGGFPASAKHWANHLLVSPDGARFAFLHRWRSPAEGTSWKTRMITASAEGRDLHVLIPNGKVSHFVWRDPLHILAYAGVGDEARQWAFQVFQDRTREAAPVAGMLKVDGHCTYLPGRRNEWILCDTYPDRRRGREQALYVVHVPSGRRLVLGRFPSPEVYEGEWRCDLHPRSSRDGRRVCIDSAHGGDGRQMYLIELAGIV